MAINWDTTWIGFLGGGVSGSVIGGGSIYQIDVWNMGGNPLPARTLITGKRVGVVAEVNAAHAMLLITGCKSARDMDGITSSGIDWELSVGVKGSALVKSGAKVFKAAAAEAAAQAINWAAHESAKRVVQWAMDDLGVVQPGKQFNLLPSPLALGVGAGIFYEWQTLQLLSGNVGWQHISPKWYIESNDGNLDFHMYDIPEQDGTKVRLGLAIDEWGFDPFIRWRSKTNRISIDSRNPFQVIGYSYGGRLYANRSGKGKPGISLNQLQPVGRLEQGMLSVTSNTSVQQNGTLTIYPAVFKFGNYPYWESGDKVVVTLDSEGCIATARQGSTIRS